MYDEGILVARLFLGIPFLIWGAMKLRGGEARLVPMLSALGLPDATALAYLVGLCELAGGIMVVLGYPARLASVLLGIWCLATGAIAHRSDTNDLLLHVTMAGGFFALAASGAGALALFEGAPPLPWAYLP